MTRNNTINAARILIRNGKDVLIVRRSESSRRAGEWEIPGGLVDQGESFEEAAIREAEEETGIVLDKIKYQDSTAYEYDGVAYMVVVFEAETTTKDIHLSPEHDKYDWVDESTYDNVNFSDEYKRYFNKVFNNRDKMKTNDDSNTTAYNKLIIYTDGGSRGNPGPSASGYVIMDDDENVIDEGGEYLGITTNNQAEYQAVKLALEKARAFGSPEVAMRIDSLLVVNQMNGVYKIRNRDLWPIHESIKELATHFKSVSYSHVRREGNSLADAKVNEVLDAQAQSDS